jgi:phospholipid/cholesterol/gamma-HCH transport system permease protein
MRLLPWPVLVYLRFSGIPLNTATHDGGRHRDGSVSVAAKSDSFPLMFENALKKQIFHVQDYARLAFRSVEVIFTTTRYFDDLLHEMDQIGVGSSPIVIAALICVGGVIVLNAASQFTRFGETALTGDALSLSLLRELGPVFTALLVAGRNATGMASQLGSMLVTEQVDAIRGLGVDPIRKLVAPRLLATVLVLPLLVAVGDGAGLIGGFVVASDILHINAEQFWTRAIKALAVGDLVIGFSKPIVFGFIIATVGCYQGLRVEGGTAGVGRATIMAFVASSLMILVSDLFLTRFLLYLFNM